MIWVIQTGYPALSSLDCPPTRNRVQRERDGAGTRRFLPRTDCGWQNAEPGASNRSEYPMPLASNSDCIEPAVPPQTSGMRGALPLFAMISLQPTAGVLPEHSFPQVGFRCHTHGSIYSDAITLSRRCSEVG